MQQQCLICNENLKNINVRWLIACKCDKLFHDRCLIDSWHIKEKCCPHCKIQHEKNKKYYKNDWDFRFIMNNKEVKPIEHGDEFIDD